MAKFTLTITNNENGKADVIETNAIIAGVHNEKECGAATLLITACNAFDVATTIKAARDAIKKAIEKAPTAAMLAAMNVLMEGEEDE